jgi:DNA-binding CsgD family transcriptional regulator
MSGLERELAELGGDIKVALEEIRVPAVLVDRSGTIRWINRTAREEAGGQPGEHVTSVVAPEARRQMDAVLATVLSRGTPAEARLPIRFSDGSVAVREISVVPLREGDSVVGIFGLGERSSGEPSDTPAVLTRRQREVLTLLAAGKSTQQISVELGVSQTTVRNHVANLLAALGVHTRLQAVMAAARAGLIEPSTGP